MEFRTLKNPVNSARANQLAVTSHMINKISKLLTYFVGFKNIKFNFVKNNCTVNITLFTLFRFMTNSFFIF